EEISDEKLVPRDNIEQNRITEESEIELELKKREQRFIAQLQDNALSKDYTPEEIEQKLTQYKKDSVLLASIFKTAKKQNPELNFEDFKDLSFERKPATELTDEEKEEMIDILMTNWISQSDVETAEFIADTMKKSFTNQKSTFHLLYSHQEIIGFIRFDKMDDDSLYAGSLNIRMDMQSSLIGESTMQSTVDLYAKNSVIHANAAISARATEAYVEEFGLLIDGIEIIDLPGGKKLEGFSLTRNDQVEQLFTTRRLSKVEILSRNDINKRTFDLSSEKQLLIDFVRAIKDEGGIISHFIIDPHDKNKRIVVVDSLTSQVAQNT
ncbi:hypothetical protein KJ766_01140, partial [Patescibacteria group bacterium]|nr:hypothetical protein [Patescibacteria group bacterium]